MLVTFDGVPSKGTVFAIIQTTWAHCELHPGRHMFIPSFYVISEIKLQLSKGEAFAIIQTSWAHCDLHPGRHMFISSFYVISEIKLQLSKLSLLCLAFLLAHCNAAVSNVTESLGWHYHTCDYIICKNNSGQIFIVYGIRLYYKQVAPFSYCSNPHLNQGNRGNKCGGN